MSLQEFKIGDRVKIVRHIYGSSTDIGWTATVYEVNDPACNAFPEKGKCIHIRRDNPNEEHCAVAGEITHIEKGWVWQGIEFTKRGYFNRENPFAQMYQSEFHERDEAEPIKKEVRNKTMAQFKIGDLVRVTHATYSLDEEYVGRSGTIIEPFQGRGWILAIDGNKTHMMTEPQLELVSPKPKQTFMKKLSTLAKKTFDTKTQNYIKLGWLDESLEVTSEGQKAAATCVFSGEKLDEYAATQVAEAEKESKAK